MSSSLPPNHSLLVTMSALPFVPPPPQPPSAGPSTPLAGRPSKKKGDKDKIRRPPNSWIIFRTDILKQMRRDPQYAKVPQAEMSGIISAQWHAAPPEVKAHYEQRADFCKFEHKQQHPDYTYKPSKKEDKKRRKEEEKQERLRERLNKRRGVMEERTPPVFTSSHHQPYYCPPRSPFDDGAYPSPPLSRQSTPSRSCSPLPSAVSAPSDASTLTQPSSPQSPLEHFAANISLSHHLSVIPLQPPQSDVAAVTDALERIASATQDRIANWGFELPAEPEPSGSHVIMPLPQGNPVWHGEETSQFLNDVATQNPSLYEVTLSQPSDTAPQRITLGAASIDTASDPSHAQDLDALLIALGITPQNMYDSLTEAPEQQEMDMNQEPFSEFVDFDSWGQDIPVVETPAIVMPKPAPYAPPSGATNHSMRRVGGCWRAAPESTHSDNSMDEVWDSRTFQMNE